MVHVIASIRIKEGALASFLEIFQANLAKVRKEAGCIEYFPAIDLETSLPPQERDSNIVTVIERWESLDALNGHLTAPHMRVYRERTASLVESLSIKVLQAVPEPSGRG